jgi:hypothetical protein
MPAPAPKSIYQIKVTLNDDVYPLYYLHTLARLGGFVMGGQARVWTAFRRCAHGNLSLV